MTKQRRQPDTRPLHLRKHVPVRFTAEMVEQVKEVATDDGMTVSSWIRKLVADEVARRQRNGTPSHTLRTEVSGPEVTVTWTT